MKAPQGKLEECLSMENNFILSEEEIGALRDKKEKRDIKAESYTPVDKTVYSPEELRIWSDELREWENRLKEQEAEIYQRKTLLDIRLAEFDKEIADKDTFYAK